MNFSLSEKFKPWSRPSLQFTREDLLVWGIIISIFSLFLIIGVDTLLFYQTLALEKEEAQVLPQKITPVSEKDLEEVIKLLDERQKRFDSLAAP